MVEVRQTHTSGMKSSCGKKSMLGDYHMEVTVIENFSMDFSLIVNQTNIFRNETYLVTVI